MKQFKHQHITLLTAITVIMVLFVVAVVAFGRRQPLLLEKALASQLSVNLPVQQKPKLVKARRPRKRKPVRRKPAVVDTTLLHGRLLLSNGKPVKGVVVSDGFSCVRTDAAGRYQFPRNPQARFVYYSVPDWCEVPTHTATDFTACAYQRIERTDSAYNFRLKALPKGKERRYVMVVFGDPQVTNAISPYYTGPDDNPVTKSDLQRFTEETMADVRQTLDGLPSDIPVYGLSMGDDVQYYGGFNAGLELQIRQALGALPRMRLFSVIGNHDQDGKEEYKAKWEEAWGPADYSFDRGDEHYVCFNDCHFFRGAAYWQPGELSPEQMEWLRQDLALADHRKKVVLCYHIPLTMGNRPKTGAFALNLSGEKGHYASSLLPEILRLLSSFKGGYELFCGHTHFAINHEIDFEGQHLFEHCHAAACGTIWQSNVNICGTPNGYYVYNFRGTRIADSYYKGTFWAKEKQMSIFRAETDYNGETYAADWKLPKGRGVIVANVFNADSRWKVEAVENGVAHPMQRINTQGQDAFATGYHHKYAKSVSYQFVSKKNSYLIMNHLYWYEPTSANAEVTVRAVDPYGNVYVGSSRDAVTEPFFNYAHYYKREAR